MTTDTHEILMDDDFQYLFTPKDGRNHNLYTFHILINNAVNALKDRDFIFPIQERTEEIISLHLTNPEDLLEPFGNVFYPDYTPKLLSELGKNTTNLAQRNFDRLNNKDELEKLKADGINLEELAHASDCFVMAGNQLTYLGHVARVNLYLNKFLTEGLCLPYHEIQAWCKIARLYYFDPTDKSDISVRLLLEQPATPKRNILAEFQVHDQIIKTLERETCDLEQWAQPRPWDTAMCKKEGWKRFFQDELNGWMPPSLEGYIGPVLVGYSPEGNLLIGYSHQDLQYTEHTLVTEFG